MKKIFLQVMTAVPVLLSGIAISSCGDKSAVNTSIAEIPAPSIKTELDSAFRTYSIKESDDLSFIEKEVSEIHVIPLETTDEATIGRISDVRFVNDTVVIVDAGKAQRIFLFDMSGKFLRTIGGKGEGPGEYASINSVTIDGKGVEIRDWISQKWLRYDYSGNCIWEKILNKVIPQNMAVLNDSVSVGAFAGYFENEPFQLTWVRNDSVTDTALPFESRRSQPAGTFINGSDGTLKYLPFNCDTVYRVDPNGLVALFSLGLYAKDEMKNYNEMTSTLTEPEYNETLYAEDGDAPVNMIDFKELPDKWIVTHQKNRNQWISVIDRNSGKTRTYVRSVFKTRSLPVPLLFYDNSDNSLSSFINEEFESVGEEDRKRVFSKIKDPDMIKRIQNYDSERNNPFVFRIILK